MHKLSVVILTKNEEENIARAIQSVKPISQDIVIIDSGSTDRTLQIAEKAGARIFHNPLVSFASQRNISNAKAQHDWVLSMDADEEIPPDLQKEILLILQGPEFDAYLIPRRNIIFGREIKHTRWSPDRHVWLYDKTKGSWTGPVHEEFKTRGIVGILKHGKIHHSHKTVQEFLEMMNRYTEIEAAELVRVGRSFSMFSLIYYPVRSFIGRFFYKKGFLDGYHGFVLSMLRAFYHFTTWAKVWERTHHD